MTSYFYLNDGKGEHKTVHAGKPKPSVLATYYWTRSGCSTAKATLRLDWAWRWRQRPPSEIASGPAKSPLPLPRTKQRPKPCVSAFRSEAAAVARGAAERPSFLFPEWILVLFGELASNTHRKKSKGKKKKKKNTPTPRSSGITYAYAEPPILTDRVNCQSLWRSLGEEKDNRDEKQGPVLVGCCRAIWPAGRLALVWLWREHGGNSVNELVRDGVSKWR